MGEPKVNAPIASKANLVMLSTGEQTKVLGCQNAHDRYISHEDNRIENLKLY